MSIVKSFYGIHTKPGDVIVYRNKLAVVLNKTNLKTDTEIVILQNLKIKTATYHKNYSFKKINKHNVNHIKI